MTDTSATELESIAARAAAPSSTAAARSTYAG